MAKDDMNDLSKHPEVTDSAAKYFNISSNRIPQEIVPRGDSNEPTMDPYEITSQDIAGLAVYATGIINQELLQSNKESALLDACLMAVRDKDSGKYDGRVSSKTQGLILAAMESLSKSKGKENIMSKKAEKEKSKKEEAPVVNPLGVGKQVGPGGQIKDKSQAQKSKELNALPAAVRNKLKAKKASLIERIDKAANSLEEGGNSKLAEQLDIVANTIDGIDCE